MRGGKGVVVLSRGLRCEWIAALKKSAKKGELTYASTTG